MNEYKPSFVFQSKINENIDNITTEKTAQADTESTIGSVNPNDVSSISYPTQPLSFDYSADNLRGGQFSSTTLSNEPSFQEDIILAAAKFICDGLVPTVPCPGYKTAVVKNDGSLGCGCPSNEEYDFSDSDIQDILDRAGDVLREAREKTFEDSLNSSDFHNQLDNLGSPDPTVQGIIDDVKNKVEETLKDRNFSMSGKAEETSWLLEQMLTALIISDLPVNEGTEGAINNLKEIIGETANTINNDCALNASMITPEIIKLILSFNNKKERTCPGDRILVSDYCGECVCPSGHLICYVPGDERPYESTDQCLICPSGSIAKHVYDWTGMPTSCKCGCPEGTVETFVGDPMAVRIPTWAGGPTEEEYRASAYACLPPCPEGMVREKFGGPCKCPKNTGSWFFPKIELVDAGDCDTSLAGNIRSGFTPNPKNKCECDCLYSEGKRVYSNVNNDITGFEERCRSICPDPLEYDWDSDSCICPDPSGCPAGQTKSPANNCLCSSGSYSYTNLTSSELAKIATDFGYSFNTNIDLL